METQNGQVRDTGTLFRLTAQLQRAKKPNHGGPLTSTSIGFKNITDISNVLVHIRQKFSEFEFGTLELISARLRT